MSPKVPIDVVLNPAARLLWRASDIVQLELGSRAVLVEGIDSELAHRLVPRRTAARAADVLDRLDVFTRHSLAALAEAGYLWSRQDRDEDLRLTPPEPRLAADLAALATRHSERAAELMNARRHCTVAVHGTSRVAAQIAALLAAAGVGRVHGVDTTAVRLHQAAPGGVRPSDEGVPLATALASAVDRAAPEANTTALPMGEQPDLVMIAIDEPVDAEQRDALHVRGCAHLVVRLGADHGVVGPLVIPGLTSCLRCADLHRRDRDPAWSALALQLTVPRPHGTASDVTVAAVVAGVAAMQALTYLDGGEPAVIDGTLELHLPDWRLRRRSWPTHPECGCAGRAPE